MVNIGQILIKIGTLEDFKNWQFEGDLLSINRETFIKLMMSPGIPCYSARKTVNEKWASLRDYFGLADGVLYPNLLGKDGKPVRDSEGNIVFDYNALPLAYVLNKKTAKRLIEDTIPKRIRNNYVAREHYLKTGEVW